MNNADAVPLDQPTRYSLIILAVLQGYALYFLHLALTEEAWPATDMRWLKAFYTLAIGLPAFFYLGMEQIQNKRNAITAAVLAVVLFLLGWHLGWVESAMGTTQRNRHEFTPPFIFSLGVTVFILAFFYRSWMTTNSLRFEYNKLLAFSWQQALTLGLLSLFIGVFWLLLKLWGGLFSAIGVTFFEQLFEEPAFVYPVTWLVLGLGLVLIRNRIRLVATVQFMCEALIKALLPLAAMIVTLFLATLPFTGLQPIWDTGSAAFMMMALTLILLFFFNAVLSSSSDQPPYPLPLRYFVFAAVLLLPVCIVLATWALWLRIDQYGLTPARLWAGAILLLTASYTFSYTTLILWKRIDSVRHIQSANTWLALLVVGVLVLVNTPVADFRSWSAHSQAARLLDGKVEPDSFDYAYMRFSLGAYGVRELRKIEASGFATENPDVAKHAVAVMKQEHRYSDAPLIDKNDLDAVAKLLKITPSNESLPKELLKLVIDKQPKCLNSTHQCEAVRLSAEDDGADWLVFYTTKTHEYALAYVEQQGEWMPMGRLSALGCSRSNEQNDSVPSRMHGPFLVYVSGDCIYPVSPDTGFLSELRSGASNEEHESGVIE